MTVHNFYVRRRSFTACAVAFVLLLPWTHAAAGLAQRGQRFGRRTSLTKASRAGAVPFRVGERLTYRVLWSKYDVHAADLEFAVVAFGNFFDHSAWHFRLQAHTMDTTRMLYTLDDQFDSYTDAAHLTSLQYEMYLREQGKQQNDAWRISTAGAAAPANATAARVLPGTRDPVGLLYALRAADWKKAAELRTPVFDGHHLYDVVARLGQEPAKVTVPAGEFDASRIDIRVFERGRELSNTHFSLWLAQDPERTPVLIEAAVPIGTARVELTAMP
jgi:Protein of unknown function (DUF3108)